MRKRLQLQAFFVGNAAYPTPQRRALASHVVNHHMSIWLQPAPHNDPAF
jgi:hypothetical protein